MATTAGTTAAGMCGQIEDAEPRRQVLSLVLEVRAELAAAQERILSRLSCFDQRVARMERNRARAPNLSAVRPDNTRAVAKRIVRAPARWFKVDDLSSDLLALVAAALEKDDELAAALSCCKLRSAVALKKVSDGMQGLKTADASAFVSCARLAWSVACGLPLSNKLCKLAAERGQLLQLSWLRSRGCLWDERTCKTAARGGHLAVLRWASFKSCPWDGWTCMEAAEGGHLAVLQWARANGCAWCEATCMNAAHGGHLAVLQWARANGCPWHEGTCFKAARGGHLAVLQWAHANGCRWSEETCYAAARGGQLAVLQWARASGCPWNETTCWSAAEVGHLAMLQWARANGCPWDERTCHGAAEGGQLAVLQWARANGCPCPAQLHSPAAVVSSAGEIIDLPNGFSSA